MICDKDKVAKDLIDWHFRVEPGMRAVYRMLSLDEDSEDEPIKLLEVSEDTLDTGRVDAFVFGPTEDIPCSTVIAIVSGHEMEQITSGQIKLPEGWDLGRSTRYERPRKQRVRK